MAELRIYCLHLIVNSIYLFNLDTTLQCCGNYDRERRTVTARNPQSRGEQWRKEHAGPSSSPREPTQVQQGIANSLYKIVNGPYFFNMKLFVIAVAPSGVTK